MQSIDSKYDNIAEFMGGGMYGIVMPITISIGVIRNFALYGINYYDVFDIDRIQLAIVSNTVNTLEGAKLEFLAQMGFGNEFDNVTAGSDFKSYNVADSKYNAISDLNCNYHFLCILVHINAEAENASAKGLLAKSYAGSPLVNNKALQNGICAGFKLINNAATKGMLNDQFLVKSGDDYIAKINNLTNLNRNFPYIEFYQERGV